MGSVNSGNDPIQNRLLSDKCWNSEHKKCAGYRDSGGACGCLCHSSARRVKTSRKAQEAQTMNILNSGCGVIEIK